MAIIAAGLTGCDNDSKNLDEPDNNKGKITALHENGYLANYVVIDASYNKRTLDQYGTAIVLNEGAGGSFNAQMYDANDEDDDYYLVQSWRFQTKDELKVGQKLHLTDIYYKLNYSDTMHYPSDESEGDAVITNVKDGRITIKFTDFKFLYYYLYHQEITSREVLVNGEITYDLDDY